MLRTAEGLVRSAKACLEFVGRELVAKKPEQENFSDCGIYLLHYVEKILETRANYPNICNHHMEI